MTVSRGRRPSFCRPLALLFGFVVIAPSARADESNATSQPSTPIGEVRPMFGFGYSSSYGKGPSGWGYQVGGRLQLTASSFQSFGLEASYVVPVLKNPNGRYLAIGVILEQVLWNWFLMGIGTVGYVAVAGPQQQPFGIVTNLGYSPQLARWLRLFITYRAEWIFASPVVGINSLSAA